MTAPDDGAAPAATCCYGTGDGDRLTPCGAEAANPGSDVPLCLPHLAAADAAYSRYPGTRGTGGAAAMTVRPEVVGSLIRGDGPPPSDATDEEYAAALAALQERQEIIMAGTRVYWQMLAAADREEARAYRCWRAGHRAWTAESGRRSVTPTGVVAP